MPRVALLHLYLWPAAPPAHKWLVARKSKGSISPLTDICAPQIAAAPATGIAEEIAARIFSVCITTPPHLCLARVFGAGGSARSSSPGAFHPLGCCAGGCRLLAACRG